MSLRQSSQECLVLYHTALSALDVISCVLSNTSFKMTTYPLSRSMPVNSVACGGKEKQQVIISKQHNYAHYKNLVYENTG